MNLPMAKQLISGLWKDNREFIVKNSLGNCHVKGFNSILLLATDVLTIRLYYTRAGETNLDQSYYPQNDNLLIHNHGFNFECLTLKGFMHNLWFTEGNAGHPKFSWLHKHRYSSALSGGEPTLEHLGTARINLEKVQYIPKGEYYSMRAEELHRIWVPRDRDVAMLFIQHGKVEIEPYLYSFFRDPVMPSKPEFYNPLTEEEIDIMVTDVSWQLL